nr:immunoglobulin heavy chain junction region [Macaca mulatta]MOW88108.1 immunoglobulin heavy chain junction region [Macaca mulatta]MOW89922.1 immunoglobulin heavy chain junction region [Macaca mulatta]MOW90447.1 immunoglobulin heavy chain junction region [Macaca mulatta]MOW90577.1 immunoglobulin heavy chain junction region [Macaca mulatta]
CARWDSAIAVAGDFW